MEEGKKKGRKTNFIIFTLTTETWIYSTICHSALKELPKIKVKLDTLKYGFFYCRNLYKN